MLWFERFNLKIDCPGSDMQKLMEAVDKADSPTHDHFRMRDYSFSEKEPQLIGKDWGLVPL
jgi:hypothetical protein